MLKTFLWIIIAVLAGALVWLLLPREWGREPSQAGEAALDSTGEVSSNPALLPETAARTHEPTGQQAGAPDADRDALRLKNGKILRGKLFSQNADYVDFQVTGSKEVIRFPRTEIACDTPERETLEAGPPEAAPPPKRRGAPPAAAPEDDGENGQPEKSVWRMTAQEAQEYELKKRKEQHQRRQKQPAGIRAINIARDVRDDVEKKSKGDGFDDKGKEE